MLIRRLIRKRLMMSYLGARRLTKNHVQSHINGSLTVAMSKAVIQDVDTLEVSARTLLDGLGFEGMLLLRSGSSNGGRVAYVTFTNRELVQESEMHYGRPSPIRPLLERLELAESQRVEAGVENLAELIEASVLVEAGLGGEDDFDFSAITVELPALEASEV